MDIHSLKNGITYLRYYGNRSVENILYYGGKIAGRFIFPILLILGKEGSRESNYPESELKSKTTIFFEQLWYIVKTGEINKYYYIFGFDRKSKNDFNNYVPWLVFTTARNRKNQLPSTPTYDPYNFVCMLRDKFVFEAFCSRVGLSTPKNIGMIKDSLFFILQNQASIPLQNITQMEMNAFLKRNISCGGGMRGDVMPFRIANGLIFINEKIVDIDQFIKIIGNDGWVVQERIVNQHEALSKLHPNSINTIRIATVKIGDKIDVLFANLRIGTNGRYADNISSGGLAVKIIDGKLLKYGYYKSGTGVITDRHPNTKIVFENYEIPFWQNVIDIVKNAHRLFYGLHSVGWDVCITDDGVKIIEGNDNWDTIDAQFSGEGQDLYKKHFKI
jgi:hypothetical protein